MVKFLVAAMLLPLAMAGYVPVQWVNSGWGGWAYQQPQPQPEHQMQQQQQPTTNQWWGMQSEEEYQAYLKWCEERKIALEEQRQQQELLEQIKTREEEREHEMEKEKAQREMRMKRETMMAQWRMWQAQLSVSEEFDGQMEKYAMMKIGYMFHLTMDFLKFCHCSDYTAHLQRYLIHEGHTYQPGTENAYDLEDMDDFKITDGVEAVAQRLAALTEAEQVKVYFGGIIHHMCMEVKSYVEQVKVWEGQYNFMDMHGMP